MCGPAETTMVFGAVEPSSVRVPVEFTEYQAMFWFTPSLAYNIEPSGEAASPLAFAPQPKGVPVIGARVPSGWIDHPAMSFSNVPTPLRYTYFEPAMASSVALIESGIDCKRVAAPVVLSTWNA